MKLLIEKVKLALQKRTGSVQQKKNHASWVAKGYRKTPKVTFILQSHDKSLQICHVLPKLRQYEDAEIIVIDDGSQLEHTMRLASALTGANEFLLRANDLFENVTYDKAIRLANGQYIALMQDDDDFEDTEWVEKAINLFEQHPKMAILGGSGALDIAFEEDKKWAHGGNRRRMETSVLPLLSIVRPCGLTKRCIPSICIILTSALLRSSLMITSFAHALGSVGFKLAGMMQDSVALPLEVCVCGTMRSLRSKGSAMVNCSIGFTLTSRTRFVDWSRRVTCT